MDDLFAYDAEVDALFDPDSYVDLDEEEDFPFDAWTDEEEDDDFPEEVGEDAEGRFSRRRSLRARRRRAMRARRLRMLQRGRRSRYGRRLGSQRAHRALPPSRSTRGTVAAAPVKRAFKRTQQAIGKVDLENKVQSDILASRLASQRKRIDRNEYTEAANKIVNEIQEQFPQIKDNAFLKTAVPLLPLLLLAPEKKGSGLDAFLRDPRVLGIGAAGALAAFKGVTSGDPQKVDVQPGTGLQIPAVPNSTLQMSATVLDGAGKVVTGRTFRWRSINPAIARIDETSGLLTVVADGTEANPGGPVTIIATDTQLARLTNGVTLTVV